MDEPRPEKPSQYRERGQTTIVLVDMFQSFLKQEPIMNPHYDGTKADSEAWLSK